jgi:hypothetical protein
MSHIFFFYKLHIHKLFFNFFLYKITMLGIPAPPCAERWCTDSCPLEAKHTGTQYLTWFGKSPTSTGEVNIIRDR